MRIVIGLLLLLGACADQTVAIPDVPVELTLCMSRVPTPKPIPRIRVVQQIAEGYDKVDLAREASARARTDCATKLSRLNDWVAQLRLTGRFVPVRNK